MHAASIYVFVQANRSTFVKHFMKWSFHQTWLLLDYQLYSSETIWVSNSLAVHQQSTTLELNPINSSAWQTLFQRMTVILIRLEHPAFPHYAPFPGWSLLMDASQSSYCVWSWFSLGESLICLSKLVTCCQMWLNIKIMYLLHLLGCSFISLLISFHTYTSLLHVACIWCWILCYIPNHNMLWHSGMRGWLRCRHLIWSLHLVLGVLSVCCTYTLLHLCGLQYISDC